MKNLFDALAARELKERVLQLRPDSVRQWGKMSVTQVVAHCAAGLEMAAGDIRPPRKLIGRLIGPIVKPMALGNDQPLQRNSPTTKELLVGGDRDLAHEQQRLSALIDRFVEGGPAKCTTYPHTFFGPLTPDQWAILMYKHIDHHLRQFGA